MKQRRLRDLNRRDAALMKGMGEIAKNAADVTMKAMMEDRKTLAMLLKKKVK